MRSPSLRGSSRLPLSLALLLALTGCGGGGGGGGSEPTAPADPAPQTPTWQAQKVAEVAVGGLTTPWVQTVPADDGRIHLLYFQANPAGGGMSDLIHLVWDPDAAPTSAEEPQTVVTVDNSSGLAFGLADGRLAALYQGGVERVCGAERQSDAMFSLGDGTSWEEGTAAIGVVERNPYFHDGFAGADLAVASDSQGRFHVVYQFHYEGCDAMNARYPDLDYVVVDPAAGGGASASAEETVEGNEYGATNEQNSVGARAALAVDGDDRPVAFYYAELADGTIGLRAARRVGGVWERSWVETGCQIGRISAARAPSGEVMVAYYVTTYSDRRDEDHLLRFAREHAGVWSPVTVDDTSRCGDYPSLAFDAAGLPRIAYRDLETHTGRSRADLKLATFGGATWSRETVASTGDTGWFNALWTDAQDRTVISTYAATDHAIYLYRREPAP